MVGGQAGIHLWPAQDGLRGERQSEQVVHAGEDPELERVPQHGPADRWRQRQGRRREGRVCRHVSTQVDETALPQPELSLDEPLGIVAARQRRFQNRDGMQNTEAPEVMECLPAQAHGSVVQPTRHLFGSEHVHLPVGLGQRRARDGLG